MRCDLVGSGAVLSLGLALARAGAAPARAHVLVVDDNAINQKVAVRMLESLGYRPDVPFAAMKRRLVSLKYRAIRLRASSSRS